MTPAPKAEPRRAVPMKIQRDAALDLCATLLKRLGMVPVEAEITWELDHDPALCLRPVDPNTRQHVPHQHDRQYLVWLTKEAHARKTHGPGAERRITTAGSDRHIRDKTDRLSAAQEETRKRILAPREARPVPKSRWQGSRLPGRDPDKPRPTRSPDKCMPRHP